MGKHKFMTEKNPINLYIYIYSEMKISEMKTELHSFERATISFQSVTKTKLCGGINS